MAFFLGYDKQVSQGRRSPGRNVLKGGLSHGRKESQQRALTHSQTTFPTTLNRKTIAHDASLRDASHSIPGEPVHLAAKSH